MTEISLYKELGKQVAEEALDGYIYKGKTLREWIDILEQQPCEDAISRQEVLDAINTYDKFGYTETGCFVREPKGDYVPYIHYDDAIKCIKNVSPVTPKKKTGWHIVHGMYEDRFWCSCGFIKIMDSSMIEWKYCPVCGGESEVQNENN